MEEKIGDKIRRFANLPHVVEKRRQLRAMYYLAKKEGGECSFEQYPCPIESVSGLVRMSPLTIVTLWLPIPGCPTKDSVEKLALYPMDTYTSAGEHPHIKEERAK